jgi:hypothetical protein
LKRWLVGVLVGSLPLMLLPLATRHSVVAEGILWNGDRHCMKGRDGVGHTPYLDARTISLKDAFHSGIECGDYDAVGQDGLKISPNLGKLRKHGYKKCRDYGTFTNPSDDVEVLGFVANPEDPPAARGSIEASLGTVATSTASGRPGSRHPTDIAGGATMSRPPRRTAY